MARRPTRRFTVLLDRALELVSRASKEGQEWAISGGGCGLRAAQHIDRARHEIRAAIASAALARGEVAK